MNNEQKRKFKPVDQIFETNHYKSNSEQEKGLADTHEQVSDSYMASTGNTHKPEQ